MKKFFILLLIIILYSCTAPTEPPKEPIKPLNLRISDKGTVEKIALFGDSRVWSLNEAQIDLTCYNFGQNAATSEEVLDIIIRAGAIYNLNDFNIILFVGRNDAYFNKSVDSYKANISAIINMYDISIISCIPDSEFSPWGTEHIKDTCNMFNDWLKLQDLGYIDMYNELCELNGYAKDNLMEDHVHFNEDGKQYFYNKINSL